MGDHYQCGNRIETLEKEIERLRALLERVAQQREPLCDRHNSDICDCLGDDIERALRGEDTDGTDS